MINDSSIITLKKKAVIKNIKFLKKRMGPKVVISSVVKANAYGHGIEVFVPLLEKAGINHFSVFDYSEACRVEESLNSPKPIMIMGWIADNKIKDVIEKGFEFFVFTLDRLERAVQYARFLKIPARIHLEVETGMNRSGLNKIELIEAIDVIKNNMDAFEIKGFCTHLAGAESISNYHRILNQLKLYNKRLALFEESGLKAEYRHVANSAAAMVYPRVRMDMVRIGIMQYGFWSSVETFIHYTSNRKDKSDPLERILGWESKIMSIKEVQEGDFVGYGISFLAQRNMRIALIPVGYSLGYSRSLSNKGRVLINGIRCGVIGLVNMNMIIADVSDVENVSVGDEVVIIGKQGNLEIKVSAFSNISNALNYEVLAHLPTIIKRKVID